MAQEGGADPPPPGGSEPPPSGGGPLWPGVGDDEGPNGSDVVGTSPNAGDGVPMSGGEVGAPPNERLGAEPDGAVADAGAGAGELCATRVARPPALRRSAARRIASAAVHCWPGVMRLASGRGVPKRMECWCSLKARRPP